MSEPTWELLGGGGVVGGPIDYVGAWAAGTTYQPGQVVRYGGIDYLAVNVSLGQVPPASTGLGTYQAYTPVLTADGTNPTLGGGSANGRYCRIGNHVHYLGRILWGAGSTAGLGNYNISLPVAANLSGVDYRGALGMAELWGLAGLAIGSIAIDPGLGGFYVAYSPTWPIGTTVGIRHDQPWAWSNLCEIDWSFTYEAAP